MASTRPGKKEQIALEIKESTGRRIEEFKGDSLIVAGGWADFKNGHNPSPLSQIRTPENFYTIDKSESEEPDLVADFTHPEECASLPDERFDLIFFEFISQHGKFEEMFKTSQRILKKNGVLIYTGNGGSGREIPDALLAAEFKYIKKISYFRNFFIASPDNLEILNDEALPELAKNILYQTCNDVRIPGNIYQPRANKDFPAYSSLYSFFPWVLNWGKEEYLDEYARQCVIM